MNPPPYLTFGRRPSNARLTMTVVASLAAVMASLPTTAAAERSAFAPPAITEVPAVPVATVKPKPAGLTAMPRNVATPAPAWPSGSATVDLPMPSAAPLLSGGSAARPPSVRAGRLPVELSLRTPGRGAVGTVRVKADVLDRAITTKAAVKGVLLRVSPVSIAGGRPYAGPVSLTVDYRGFAGAFGADWATRLRLVSLPACALTTPGDRRCAGRPLASVNDRAAGTVTASVPLGEGVLLALTAGTGGPAGDYAATSLQPSSTWSAGGNSGAFSWSYPMRVPPAPGGPAPLMALTYSSQSVDGRHAASNNQPSWVGEGFESTAGGFIERRYRSCAKDMDGSANNDEETGDLCWETDNATLSLSGRAGELIYNAVEDQWHLRGDDGSKVQRLAGASNGDNNGEHWVVTTTDGTQYWFGLQRVPGWDSGDPVTSSTFTAPVFGNDPGEPCHATAFADSDCVQAWRWNLDYIVDVHGNSMSLWYTKETNKYGRNLDPDDAAAYDRGGYLTHVAYGTRRVGGVDSVLDASAPAKVVFGVADRCLSGCGTHDETHWPDTPWDTDCAAAPCDTVSPSFWSTKRLQSITTQVWGGAAYRDVERWTFTHTFPDPGDDTRAGLWLSKISHQGLVGTTTSTPDVEFTGVQLANRVDTIDFAAAMNWWRIAQIRTETGATISVTYSAPDCIAGQPMPAPHNNTRRCYPVIWTPEGYEDPVTDWFHKYVVTTIYENDNTGGMPPAGSPRVAYQYSYLDGAAWHYADDDGIIDPDEKTWSQWRGYARVGVTIGDPGEQTYSETRYLRGMHGDKQPSGTRTVTVSGTGVPDVNDENAYAGMLRESTVFNGPGGAVVSREVGEPWQSAPTATRTINGSTTEARFTGTAASHQRTARDAGRPDRVTTVRTAFDSYGMAVQVDDLGDVASAGDEACTKLTYEPRNTGAWLLDRVHQRRTYAVECAETTGTLTEDDILGETRTFYDDQAYLTAPVRGLSTRVETMSAWNGGSPTFIAASRAAYDSHGRKVQSWNAVNALTSTAYTPATGGPVTGVTVTNAMSHVTTTTTIEPAWGMATSTVDPNGKRTDFAHDGLGRLTSIWLPNRNKATQTANTTFAYLIRADASTVVSTSALNAAETYVTSYTHYDGLLRPRQTQPKG